jgi:hypothetical protein
MLTNPLIFRSLVNFLREHEVLETAILDNYALIYKFDIQQKYKYKNMLDNERWLAYELANLLIDLEIIKENYP